MFYRELTVNRNSRYRPRNLKDTWRTYRHMCKSGQIRAVPKCKNINLHPVCMKEDATICWKCRCVVFGDQHYTISHKELSRDEQKDLLNVGRGLLNRFTGAGSEEEFTKTKKMKALFLERLQLMYGLKDSKKLGRIKRATKFANKRVKTANAFIQSLKEECPLTRHTSVSLGNLVLCRNDLIKNSNMYCIGCGVWVTGGWSGHVSSKHKNMTKWEKQVLKLYSGRIKAEMVTALLLVKSARMDAKKFMDHPTAVNYAFFTKAATMLNLGTDLSSRRRTFGIRETNILADKYTIRMGNYTSHKGKTLNGHILAASYKSFKKYGKGKWTGFTNIMEYFRLTPPFSDAIVEKLRKMCPANRDSINFLNDRLEMKFSPDGGNHVVLVRYDAALKQIIMYDGVGWVRKEDIYDYFKGILAAHYGHVGLSLRAGYSQGYPVQYDGWSCAYRAIFACLAIFSGKDPEKYEMVYSQLFKFVKRSVERKGVDLKNTTLDEIWAKVSKEHKKTSEEDIVFERINE